MKETVKKAHNSEMTIINSNRNIVKKLGWGLMTLFAVMMFIIASTYLSLDPDSYFPIQKLIYLDHTAEVITHIGGAMMAIVTGPFLFLKGSLATKYISVHRWLGRIYLVSVLFGGLGALYMTPLAHGGIIAQLGFGLMGLFWLTSAFMGYKHIRQKNIRQHQVWMTRCYALTFAAVTLRLWMFALMTLGIDFLITYRIIAWLCWVPNLVVGEWIYQRKQSIV